MSNKQTKQTSETSDANLLKMRLRFVKEDLGEIIDKLWSLSEEMKDTELQDQLRWRSEDVEDILNDIEEREDKVDELIKSIAS